MHVRLPLFAPLQRTLRTDSSLYNCLVESWRAKDSASRYHLSQFCCQRGSKHASTSRSHLSSPITPQRRQQQQQQQRRRFLATSEGRDQKTLLLSKSTHADNSMSGGLPPVLNGTGHISVNQTMAEAIADPPDRRHSFFAAIPTSNEEAQKKLSTLYTTEAQDELLQIILKYIQESSNIYKQEIEGEKPPDKSIETLKINLERLYSAWSMAIRLMKNTSRNNFHTRVARVVASIGDYCRRLRVEASSILILQELAGKYTESVVDYAEEQLRGQERRIKQELFILDCLRSRSFSLRMEEEQARRSLEILLAQEVQWEKQFGQVQKEQTGSRGRQVSHPRLQNLVDAFAGYLQMILQKSRGRSTKERHDLAVELFEWLLVHPNRLRFNSFLFNDIAFRLNVIVGFLKDPLTYLQEKTIGLSHKESSNLVCTICICLLRRGATFTTNQIFRWSRDAKIVISESILREMARKLTFSKEFDMADVIIKELHKKERRRQSLLSISTCRVMANCYARMKEEDEMEKMLKVIDIRASTKDRSSFNEFAFRCRLLLYSLVGDVVRAIEMVERRYDMRIGPGEIPAKDLLYPDYELHSLLVQLYLNRDQIIEAESMLHRMVRFGHHPSATLLSSTMEYYARIDDATNTLSLFKQMIQAKLELNVQVYTTLIAFFAKRKDASGAEAVMDLMKENGVKPDKIAYTALLDAYVEGGRWQQTIDLFDWMIKNNNYNLKPPTSAYNIMIKAHVNRSVPIQEVYAFYKNMLKIGLIPSRETYGMVLQSAVDAGMMNIAEEIFSSIEEKLGGRFGSKTKKGADVYNFTTMIQGYLRKNMLQSAKAYAGELRDRGYKGTGVLWNILAKVYIADDRSRDLEASQRLIGHANFENAKEYADAYSPLINTFGKRAMVGEAEGILNLLEDKKSEIPLSLWSSLLNAFRNENNVEGALNLWKLIYEKASSILQNDSAKAIIEVAGRTLQSSENRMTADHAPISKPVRSNLLCLPLCTMIDLLSRHGMFEEIAQIWIQCRNGGFAFDSHNWNHLCISFLKAGRIRDSLNIIEKVLNHNPPSREWREYNEEDIERQYVEMMKSRESIVEKSSNESEYIDKLDAPDRPPNRRYQSRHRDIRSTLNPLIGQEQESSDDDYDDGDDDSISEVADGKAVGRGNPHEDEQLDRSGQREKHKEDILSRLRFDVKRAQVHSPWYAHLRTMSLLSKTMHSLQNRGGIIQTGKDTFASINELYQAFPRMKELLELYERKVEENEDQRREKAAQFVRYQR